MFGDGLKFLSLNSWIVVASLALDYKEAFV